MCVYYLDDVILNGGVTWRMPLQDVVEMETTEVGLHFNLIRATIIMNSIANLNLCMHGQASLS